MKRVHHKTLTLEKWSRFSFTQRLLMIATEFHRARQHLAQREEQSAVFDLEHAFELLDLTKADHHLRFPLRKELCRLREVLGFVYLHKDQGLLDELYLYLLSMDRVAFDSVSKQPESTER